MKIDGTLYAVAGDAGIELILRADQVVPYLLAAQNKGPQARVVALETTDTYAFLPLQASRHVIAEVGPESVRFAASEAGHHFLKLFLAVAGDGTRVLFGGLEIAAPEASPAPPERVERTGSWNWHVATPTPGPLPDTRNPFYRQADFRKLVDHADGEAIVNALRYALASLREAAVTTSDVDARYRLEGDLNRLVVLLRTA